MVFIMKQKLLIQSLSPLFVIVSIQNIDTMVYKKGVYIGYKCLLLNNLWALIFGILSIIALFFFVPFNGFKTKGLQNPETVKALQNINELNWRYKIFSVNSSSMVYF